MSSSSHMQARTVDKTGMCLRVINDDIVTVHQRVNSGKYSLVSEIEKESVLFLSNSASSLSNLS